MPAGSVDLGQRESADRARSLIESGRCDPTLFRNMLATVLPAARDTWVDRALGLDAIPEDGPSFRAAASRTCLPGRRPVAAYRARARGRRRRLRRRRLGPGTGGGAGAPAHRRPGDRRRGPAGLRRASRALAMRLRLRSASFLSGDAGDRPPADRRLCVLPLLPVQRPPPREAARRSRTDRPHPPDSGLRRRSPAAPRPWLQAGAAAVPDLSIYRSTSASPPVERGRHRARHEAPAHRRGHLRRHGPRGDPWRRCRPAPSFAPRRRRRRAATARRDAANGAPERRLRAHPPPGIQGWTCMFKDARKVGGSDGHDLVSGRRLQAAPDDCAMRSSLVPLLALTRVAGCSGKRVRLTRR